MGRKTVVVVLALLCVTAAAVAQPPALISYQGKLLDSNGVPVSGAHDLQFDLFAAQSGGISLWTEAHTGVTITGGLFNIQLGGTTAIDPQGLLDSNPELWLQITMDGTEVFSRVQMVSAPYALVAGRLSGVNATGSGGRITFTGLPAGTAASNASVYINPASANADEALLGMTVGATQRFLVDAEGDVTADGILYVGDVSPLAGRAYHSFGTGTADSTTDIANYNDVYISDDLEIEGKLYAGSIMQIGRATPDDTQAYNSIAAAGFTPVSGEMTTDGDLAIEFDLEVGDDAYVGGTLSWGAKTGYVMVHAGGFTPESSSAVFHQDGFGLGKDENTSRDFFAPVELPNGATLTALRFWWNDTVANDVRAILATWAPAENGYTHILDITSSGAGGIGFTDDTTPNATYQVVDNANRVYFLRVDFPTGNDAGNLEFRAARITYTTTGPGW